MARNIDKLAAEGRSILTDRRNLNLGEIIAMRDSFIEEAATGNPDALINTIIKAFYFGVTIGHRQRAAEQKRS